ncbi:MAG: DUF3857 domain-containing protein [Deltaproteobacteria bacterium]|nr:DUF3857 domain-containing protein [Deltaproteobacteria bacterium]
MKRTVFLFLAAGLCASCAHTDKALVERYADITPTRFEGAVAVVLEEQATSRVDDSGDSLVFEGFRRVKLMNRKAMDCGEEAPNCRIQRWVCYNETWDEVERIEARLITPEGAVIEVDPDDMSDQTFTNWAVPDQDFRCYVWMVKGASPGAIIEERWRIRTSELLGVGDAYFQDRDPVLEARYTVDAPADYEYKWKVYNLDQSSKSELKEERKGDRLVRTWTARQVPALHIEEGMVAPDDVRGKLIFSTPRVTAFIKGAKDDETRKRCHIHSWEDLGACWQGLIIEKQKATQAVKEVAAKIAKEAKTETDKVKAVWKFMNDNVRYVGLERGLAGFVPLSAHVVCTKKYGDCKAVAGLISVLCRELGLKADPILIGTRPQLGKLDLDMPGLHFNHSIARVEADGKVYWLDATHRDIAYDTTPARDQGVHVVVSRPGKPFVDFIPVQGPETNRFDLQAVFTPAGDGAVEMDARITTTGNVAEYYRSYANEYNSEKWRKWMETELSEDYPQATLETEKSSGKEDNNAPFEIELKARIARAMQPAGKGVSFEVKTLFPDEDLSDYLKLPKRKHPVDFYYLQHRKARYEVAIPAGMRPAGLPRNLSFEDDYVKVERLAQIENDRVVAVYDWTFKQLIIPPEKYTEARSSMHKAMEAGNFVLIFEPRKEENKG